MSELRLKPEKGSTTVEYAILLPLVFACVFLVISLFLAYYQQSLIQNLAEDACESLSREWGYSSVPANEMETGVYNKTTFENREIYWNIATNSDAKENAAIDYIKNKAQGLGVLKLIEDKTANSPLDIQVQYTAGLPSKLSVHIKASYYTPAVNILGLFGIGNPLVLEGRAEASVYDPKDMINTTDYVVQIFMGSKAYEAFQKLVTPIKGAMDKITSMGGK